MTRVLKTIMLSSLLVLATALTGCVKFKQVLTVMPDGSGKIELTIGMSEQLVQMAKSQGEDPFAEINPDALAAESKGIVAFSRPTQSKQDGYSFITFAAYFEDINAVELGGPDDAQDPSTFTYTREGNSATLTAKNTMILSAASDHEPMAPEEKQFAAGMLAGMSFSEHYVLPGAFEPVEGVTADGNTASIAVTTQDMLDGTGAIATFKKAQSLTFTIAEVKQDQAAMDAFKAELNQAIAEWNKMKEDAGE